jgi:hypothetical protein
VAISNAQTRKLLGNPPSSPDKHTIGDEVIWELLLTNLHDDLIVVTRDSTYEQNMPLLKQEYQQTTGGHKLLLVAKNLSEAVATIGKQPAPELIEAEQKEQKSLAPYYFVTGFQPSNDIYAIMAGAPEGTGAFLGPVATITFVNNPGPVSVVAETMPSSVSSNLLDSTDFKKTR